MKCNRLFLVACLCTFIVAFPRYANAQDGAIANSLADDSAAETLSTVNVAASVNATNKATTANGEAMIAASEVNSATTTVSTLPSGSDTQFTAPSGAGSDQSNDAAVSALNLSAAQAPVKKSNAVTSAESLTGWVSDTGGNWTYYSDGGTAAIGWSVMDSNPFGNYGFQRYWFDTSGHLAVSRLIDISQEADAGAGYYAYATAQGFVVRGTYVDPNSGIVYLADNDGRLAGGTTGGWIVSDAYGQGLQRYWIDAEEHGAVPGFVDAAEAGYKAYTTAYGYALRGAGVDASGNKIFADNDARLLLGGWLVTDAYGQGLQRYWLDDGKVAANVLVAAEKAGYAAYATPAGYVVRGKWTSLDGSLMYIADNDGRLETASGWLVTDSYDGALQRYYFGIGDYAIHLGLQAIDGSSYYSIPSLGYVLRGIGSTLSGATLYADNDGRLAKSEWVVTDAYGQGLQRYWFGSDAVLETGLIDPSSARDSGSGYYAFATPVGYVVRGFFCNSDGKVYLADNDGRLESPGWLVSDSYGSGLQRYWIDAETHSAIIGFFTVDGYGCCYGIPNVGYVLRGTLGSWPAVSDNDGKIAVSEGWLITDAFGQGLQRYWVANGAVTRNQLIDAAQAGWWAYSTVNGYVVRGKYAADDGAVYLANNDGVLENPGWLVSGEYDGGTFQRYFIDANTHAAKIGYFNSNLGDSYYGLAGAGYVLRGNALIDGINVHADNDGILTLSVSADVATEKKGVSCKTVSTFVGDVSYLFLPSYANLQSVILSFDFAKMIFASSKLDGSFTEMNSGSVVDIAALGLDQSDNGAYILYCKQAVSSKTMPLYIMVSGNVRTVYVISADPNNQGRSYVEASSDHSAQASVSILVIDPDGSVVYNKDSATSQSSIKGRGNSTWSDSYKKPYQIKLGKKADLLETGDSTNINKTWLLLANANDATLLNNTIAYQLGLELGLAGTECAPADLYYDGEYRGSYLLCEKVEVKNGRVDIDDLESQIETANAGVDLSTLPTARAINKYGYEYQYVTGIIDPADISGGYLLELDDPYYATELCWFRTSQGVFVVKSPDYCSSGSLQYISEMIQEGLDCISTGSSNVYTGKSLGDYFDIDSLTKMYLVNQFMKNHDAFFASTYFYKPTGSAPVCSGPLWDFDRVGTMCSNYSSTLAYSTDGLYERGFQGILNNSEIQNRAKNIYSNAFNGLVDIVLGKQDSANARYLHSLDFNVNQVKASQAMNQVLWGLASFDEELNPAHTYAENISHMETWISSRRDWFSAAVATWCGSPIY